MTSLSLPVLSTVGRLVIQNNAVLTNLAMPELTVGQIQSLQSNAALTTCTGALIVNVGDCVQ